jgi:uncharacterized protein
MPSTGIFRFIANLAHPKPGLGIALIQSKKYNMSLETKVMDELKNAMRAKDEAALRTLRSIKAAIIIEKTAEGAPDVISEATELKLLQKLAKQRKDSLDIFEKQNRPDLAQKEREELAIIEKFLPQQMSAEELHAVLKDIIAATGASSPADIGKVMGAATKQLAGKADGKAISEAVKQLLY